MHAFKDAKDRTWKLEVTLPAMDQVQAEADVDLAGLFEDNFAPLIKLLSSPRKLVMVLWALCKEQAAAAEVSDKDFGAAFDGPALEKAADALVEETVSFFPNPLIRDWLRTVLKSSAAKGREMATAFGDELAKLDPKELLRGLLPERAKPAAPPAAPSSSRSDPLSSGSGSSPTNSPASLASTPGPSPSGN